MSVSTAHRAASLPWAVSFLAVLATVSLLSGCAGAKVAHQSVAASTVTAADVAPSVAGRSAATTSGAAGRYKLPVASSHAKAPARQQSAGSGQPAATASGAPAGSPAGSPTSLGPAQQAGGVASFGTLGASDPAAQPFRPSAVSTGSPPSTAMTVSDLTTPQASTPLTLTVSPSGPSQISLDAFASSVAGYPLNGLRACLGYSGQSCTPQATPNPAFWTITAAELARHSSYSLTVQPPSSSNLLGLRLGWTGADAFSVSGLRAAGGCSVATGYHNGCGFELHAVNASTGTITVSSAVSGLHLSVKDKTTGSKIYSSALQGSASFAGIGGDEWAAHFYPENGTSVLDVALSVRWP